MNCGNDEVEIGSGSGGSDSKIEERLEGDSNSLCVLDDGDITERMVNSSLLHFDINKNSGGYIGGPTEQFREAQRASQQARHFLMPRYRKQHDLV